MRSKALPWNRPNRGRLLERIVLDVLNGAQHVPALAVYMVIVGGHLSEHLVQVAQVFLLGWDRPDAGGLLGLVFNSVAESEILHMTYNTLQLTGLILLAPGFRGFPAARRWWAFAIAMQSWHWLEHALLIFQLATGVYFYGALKQMSVLERFVPRIELHFAYNMLAFVPTVIGLLLYLRARRRGIGGLR